MRTAEYVRFSRPHRGECELCKNDKEKQEGDALTRSFRGTGFYPVYCSAKWGDLRNLLICLL